MKYYKVLLNNHSCISSYMDWTKYLPIKNDDGTWTPGKWTRTNKKPLELCHNGYHATDAMHLLDWCNGNQLFEAEFGDQVINGDDKVVTNKMRLLRQVEGWNDKTLRLFACWCVREYCWDELDDERSKNAVIVSEKYANGDATIEELNSARYSARYAAWNAAGFAAWNAAWNTAGYAAWNAAWDAPWNAAWNADREKENAKLTEMVGLYGEWEG